MRNNFVDPEIVQEGANQAIQTVEMLVSAVSKIFGTDQVPNYPVKKLTTFQGLLRSVYGELPPPQTIEDAKVLLSKAVQVKASITNTGDAADTARMLYAEAIQALNKFISEDGKYDVRVGSYIVPKLGSIVTVNPNTGEPIATGVVTNTSGKTWIWILVILFAMGAIIFFAIRSKKSSSK